MLRDVLRDITRPSTLMFRIITVFILASLAITVTLSAFFVRNTSNMIMDNTAAYMQVYSKIISDNIDAYIGEMDRTARILLGNAGIQAIMERHNGGVDDLTMVRDVVSLQNSVISFTSLRDDYHIIIADQEGKPYYKDNLISPVEDGDGNIFNEADLWEHEDVLDRGDFLLLAGYETSYSLRSGRSVLTLARELKNLSGSSTIAYLLVTCDMQSIMNKLGESLPSDIPVDALVLSGDERVVIGLDHSRIGREAPAEKSDRRYYRHTSQLTGWTTVLSAPVQQAVTPTNVALGFFLPLAVIVTVGSVTVAVFLFAYVLSPIRRLVGVMREVKQGNLSPKLDVAAKSSDIATLYDGFERMMAEISGLTDAVVQERMLVSSAQMTALRYQISPHFFNNTLQTVEAIAEVHGVREIQVIATSLGNMLRYNIRGGASALLSEELDQVDTYLRIEQVRFRSRLSYRIESTGESRQCAVPRFILQPLVENCIVHGGNGMTRRMEVTIEAEARDGELAVIVSNTGRPMDPERLEEIRRNLAAISEETHAETEASIGIYNPHKRIVKRYGPGYGIRFLYSDERGTSVRLTMPARDSL